MEELHEIRLHGRGGQGVKLAAHILGRTAFLSGYKIQSFAVYGAERRGAPVTSFCRIDKKEVLEKGYIFDPDAVICLDETLDFGIMIKGLKKDGFILVNSNKYPGYFLKHKIKQPVYTIDATQVALKVLGKPIPNCAILGAFVKIFKELSLDKLKEAIEEELKHEGYGHLADKNIKAADVCYKKMKVR